MSNADATTGTQGGAAGAEQTRSDPVVSAHSSSPDRTVMTERGNTDAWIASDVTVRPTR